MIRRTLAPALWAVFVALVIIASGFASDLMHPSEAHASPRVLPVGRKYAPAVERWRPLVKRYFPKDRKGQVPRRLQQEALAVIQAESGGNPMDGPCFGIWQLSRDHGAIFRLRDPRTSTRIAARLYAHGGWRAWTAARRLGLR
jgi:hypothetical protein